jgi:type I restriction enzyme S subunit
MKEGWKYKKLGDVCEIFNGNSINADFKKKHFLGASNGLPFIATKDVLTNGTIDYDNGVRIPNYNEYKIAPANSVFVCAEGGSAGKKFAFVEQNVCFGNKLFCLKPKNSLLEGKFVYHFVQSDLFKDQFYALLTGLIGGVSAKKFQQIEIPIPSSNEQQRIVSRLDSAFAHIDELKANAEKQLSEARALFQKALTKAMEPKEGWEEKTLGEIADFVQGPFRGSLTKAMFKPSGYAVYEQQHAIHGHTKIRYFIDDRKYKEMERFSVEAGDLIMSCSGVTLGRVNLLPSNTPVGIINQALLKMRVKPIMNVLFFKYWLESTHFQEIIMKYSGGAAIPNVPAVKIIKEINISIPSSAEQQRIVSRLDSLSAHVRELEEVLQKTIAECDALKQALLRQVFE